MLFRFLKANIFWLKFSHSNDDRITYLDLLYSNSMCKQSSMPTSILMELFMSGYCDSVWTMMSCSFTTSLSRFTMVTRKKYLQTKHMKFKKRTRVKVLQSGHTDYSVDLQTGLQQKTLCIKSIREGRLVNIDIRDVISCEWKSFGKRQTSNVSIRNGQPREICEYMNSEEGMG